MTGSCFRSALISLLYLVRSVLNLECWPEFHKQGQHFQANLPMLCFPRMLSVFISFYCLYSNIFPLNQRDAFLISCTEPHQQGQQTLLTSLAPFCFWCAAFPLGGVCIMSFRIMMLCRSLVHPMLLCHSMGPPVN